MKYLPLVLLVAFVGCSKDPKKSDPFKSVACGIGKSIGAGVSLAISTKLECKNLDQIQATMLTVLEKGKICDKQSQSFMSFMEESPNNFMCQMMADILIENVVQNAIPKAWECNPARSVADLKASAGVFCSKLK